ncbi:MAG: ABC transporter permease [Spirochaetales bacterium]|nr:ABC transporter permease [Spirochaetales bacterium]
METSLTKKQKREIPGLKIITTTIMGLLISIIVLMFLVDILFVDGSSLIEVLSSPEIQHAFFLSLFTSILSTLIGIIIAVPTAYSLSRFSSRITIIFDIIIDLLIVIPVLVIGVSLLVTFKFGRDLKDSSFFIFQFMGWIISGWGDFFIYKPAGIILAQVMCSISFAVRAIKAAFDSIDPRTEHVALTLGCNRGMAFWKISLPLAKQGIFAGGVLAWARAYGIFGAVSIVAGAVRKKTEVLPTSVFLEISIGRLEIALGISLLMVAVAFVFLLLLRVFFGADLFSFHSNDSDR